MYLALCDRRRWRLPATPALIFSVAVSLKRFLAPDLVFSFGISPRSLGGSVLWCLDEPPWHAMGQAAPKGRVSRGKCDGKQGGGWRPESLRSLTTGRNRPAGTRWRSRGTDPPKPR